MYSLGWRNRFWIGFHLGSFVVNLLPTGGFGFHFLFLAKSEGRVAHSREIIIGVPHTLLVSFYFTILQISGAWQNHQGSWPGATSVGVKNGVTIILEMDANFNMG